MARYKLRIPCGGLAAAIPLFQQSPYERHHPPPNGRQTVPFSAEISEQLEQSLGVLSERAAAVGRATLSGLKIGVIIVSEHCFPLACKLKELTLLVSCM